MRQWLVMAALVLAGAGVGAATVAASGAIGEEEAVGVITVPVEPADAGGAPAASSADAGGTSFVVEDGIARADATRLRAAALARVPGEAISAERDDGLFQVEVRDEGGRILEVLLDDRMRVVGTDGDED
ncbi:MAG: hypothetical protein ABW060_04430 [Solirubrobacteraceae bacterium]|jgi:hypothetical protein